MENIEREGSTLLDPAGNVGRLPMAASNGNNVSLSRHNRPKVTHSCCGIAAIASWQPYLSGDGDTVYITVYECLKCHQVKF